MSDPTTIIGLASISLGVVIALQALRALYYDGKLEKLHEKMSTWLFEVEKELSTQLKSKPTIERVVEIAAKFSSVKSMQERVDEIQGENSRSIKNTTFVYIIVIVATIFNLNFIIVDPQIIFGADLLAVAFWGASIYSVYEFMGEYNDLEGKHKTKKL